MSWDFDTEGKTTTTRIKLHSYSFTCRLTFEDNVWRLDSLYYSHPHKPGVNKAHWFDIKDEQVQILMLKIERRILKEILFPLLKKKIKPLIELYQLVEGMLK